MLDTIQALDSAVLLWLQEVVRVPWLDAIFSFFTQLGNAGMLWIILSLIMLFFPKTRKAGFWALIAMGFGLLCTNVILKHLIVRPRPWTVLEGLTHLVVEHDPLSFPSGHTCAAFAAGATWARFCEKWWMKAACLAQAVLMAISRLYVGVHYPTDVLAGAAVGLLCAWLSWAVEQRYERRRGEGAS